MSQRFYKIRLGAVIVLLMGCATTKQQPGVEEVIQEVASNLDNTLSNLTTQIVNSMTEKDKKKVAVIEFSDLDGRITQFGQYLAEELTTRLFQTKRFEVIERELLNKILEEHELTLTGLIDPTSAKELGRILGVDAIVSGTITDLGASFKINARIISTETGRVFAVAAEKILKDEEVEKLISQGSGSTIPGERGQRGEFPPSPRSVKSAIQLRIPPIDNRTMENVANWATRKNQSIVLQDTALVWLSIGALGDSGVVSTEGIVTIYGFRPITRISDINKDYYDSWALIFDAISEGSGRALSELGISKLTKEDNWDNELVVFASRPNIYKRIVISQFGPSGNRAHSKDRKFLTLNVPECNIREARLTIIARYDSGVWPEARRNARYFIGDEEVLLMSTRLKDCASEWSDVTEVFKRTRGRLPFALGSPDAGLRNCLQNRPRKMVLELLTEGPCPRNLVIEDEDGNSLYDTTPCRALDDLISAQ